MEYGLIGSKLGHSYSKLIHEMLCGYRYDLCPLPTEEEARAFPAGSAVMEPAPAPGLCRCPRPSPQFRGDRIKLKALGRDGISIDRETIDLRYVEQLADGEQSAALGWCMVYAQRRLMDGRRTLRQIVDELDRLNAMPPVQHQDTGKVMLNVALPKGRLGDKVYNLLTGIGYGCPEDYNATRKLVVENPAAGIRYFLVKPSDVAIYVEHGAADVGIVGKDILTEAAADVYELLDTGLGKCRMCVAAPADYQDDPGRPVRVATKFVNIAKSYYASIGRDIDIIKLNGSIELAPILGLSDVIVDIVETGTTLRENGLRVVTEFMPISARFIANKASYQFKHREMDEMLEKLRAALAAKEEKK